MVDRTRRGFLQNSAYEGALAAIGGLVPGLGHADDAGMVAAPVARLTWLGGNPPLIPVVVNWGIPWPCGRIPWCAQPMVRAGDGRVLLSQHRPLASWPDGSLKWSGLPFSADAQGLVREERFLSRITTVTVEQAGPVRDVVRIDGMQGAVGSECSWLPFSFRIMSA